MVFSKNILLIVSVVLGMFGVFQQPVNAGKAANVGLGAVGVCVGGYLTAQLCCGNSLTDVGMFLNELRKNPEEMGALGPCSPYVGRAVVSCIPKKSCWCAATIS